MALSSLAWPTVPRIPNVWPMPRSCIGEHTDGKLSVTDSPCAETKEQLGGILVLEAGDLNQAIQLMFKHPDVKAGPFEIRPAEDLSATEAESERHRSKLQYSISSLRSGRNTSYVPHTQIWINFSIRMVIKTSTAFFT